MRRGATFSLASLLGVVTLIAVALAAMVQRWAIASYFFVTFTLAILTLAVLVAICRKGSARTFCIGAAVAGWGYLMTTTNPCCMFFGSQLLSTQFLKRGWASLKIERPAGMLGDLYENDGASAILWYVIDTGRSDEELDYLRQLRTFYSIGHSVFAIVAGWLGGLICLFLKQRFRSERERWRVKKSPGSPTSPSCHSFQPPEP
ncbi:MAG: hypothetical protein HYS13_10570 [Planctomycetia bacterium]|nr:hypothetical protein [Planctomycetia bacterium]